MTVLRWAHPTIYNLPDGTQAVVFPPNQFGHYDAAGNLIKELTFQEYADLLGIIIPQGFKFESVVRNELP